MMKKKVTAIFDIGKTNKKFFLLDSDFQEVYREYVRFDEITDDGGFPADNLDAIEKWTGEVLGRMLDSPNFEIRQINFSCYGASLVHLDGHGKRLTPLYNYLKPLSKEVYRSFYETYGPAEELSRVTGSPKLGMLNSGMQLYWLKHFKPEIFAQIKRSLHLPQYLSYLFTGVSVSEYTSIGCHTMLWDYEKEDYHKWVYQEKIDKVLPPIVPTDKTFQTTYKGRALHVGVGIHDSSAALLPYIQSSEKPFLLVSTGTWSIAINPFSNSKLTLDDIENECLFNMRINGNPVKVSRLFLGNEYKLQIRKLSDHFQVGDNYHRNIKFDPVIFSGIQRNFKKRFKWISMRNEDMPSETEIPYSRFEEAYHQLVFELVALQVARIKSAIGNQVIKRLFVDGGFSANEVYVQMLSYFLEDMKLKTTDASLGSALGAALVISDSKLESKFLKENYGLKKHSPVLPMNGF